MIETKRLAIEKIETEEELGFLLSIYSNPLNMKYIQSGKFDWTFQELEERYKRVNEEGYKHGLGMFGVKLKDTGQIIGEAGLFDSFDLSGKLELGYIVDCHYWKQGFGTEICKALINYAFKNLKSQEVVARMYDDNIGSVKICENLGFKLIENNKAPDGKNFRKYVMKNDSF